MKKIKNFFKTNAKNDKCCKTLNGSKVDRNRFCITQSLTSHIKSNIPEQDTELQLRLHLEQIANNPNLQKLANSYSYLSKAKHFFQNLTPELLARSNVLVNFEYKPYVHNLQILLYLLKDGTKIYFKEQNGRNLSEEKLDKNDNNFKLCRKKAGLFMALTQTFAYVSYYSRIFRTIFNSHHENIILDVLSDRSFILDCLKIINKEISVSKSVSNFFKNGVEFLSNLNKTFDSDSKKIYKICQSAVKFSEMTDEFVLPSLIFVSKFQPQANTTHTRYLFENLIEEAQSISNIIGHAEETSPIYFDSIRKSPITIYSKNNLFMNIIEILDTLFYLIDDYDAENLPIEYDLNSIIKNIILNGNDFEAEYAVRILFRLTFIENYKLTDSFLKSMLKKIIIYKYPNKNLIRYCESVLYMCEREERNKSLNESIFRENRKKKIMISYDQSNYEVCSLIEKELKQNEYMIWFKDINDYSLEKTLMAILSSDLVLLVLDNQVCFNLNCRLEYEFSTKSNRNILPLVTEANFSPRSWVIQLLNDHESLNLSCLSNEAFNLNLIDSINSAIH